MYDTAAVTAYIRLMWRLISFCSFMKLKPRGTGREQTHIQLQMHAPTFIIINPAQDTQRKRKGEVDSEKKGQQIRIRIVYYW